MATIVDFIGKGTRMLLFQLESSIAGGRNNILDLERIILRKEIAKQHTR